MSTFQEATAVKAVDAHTYSGFFPPNWCIGTVPHGGYVTSCILSVANLHFSTTLSSLSQPHTLTLYLTFLRRTSTGPYTVTVRDTKLGRQTSTIHVTLTQDSSQREEVVGYITHSDLAIESGISLPTQWALSPPPPVTDITQLRKDEDENWVLQKDLPYASFRKASLNVHFYLPRKGQSEKSFADEWLRFPNGERFTMESLGYVADTWPQIVEAYRGGDGYFPGMEKPAGNRLPIFWYPTLLLNLEIKKVLPPEGVEWLFVRVSAKQIKNGRLDLEVVILDEGGDIVALSQHVTLVVGNERNRAERRHQGGGPSKI